MIRKKRTSLRSLAAASALFLSLLAASCATVVRGSADVEAERLLPPGATAYARLDRATLTAVVAAVAEAGAKGAGALLERTDYVTAAFLAPGDSGSGGLVGVAEGRYPAGAASLKLSTDPAWRRNGPLWERKDGSLSVAFTDAGRAFIGTAPLDGLLAASAAPNQHPIPARWIGEWSAPVAVYLPRPMELLRERIPLGDGAIPMAAMMLSGKPAAAGGYLVSLCFEFETERAAVVFGPLCRLFLYVAANALWPERAATVLDAASWSASGTVVRADGIPLEAGSIAAFLGMAGL